MMRDSTTSHFLDRIRVIDRADEKASFRSRLLADLGSEVVEAERPGGDPARRTGPFRRDGEIIFDIERDSDREVLRDLTMGADMLVETFSPGYLDGLGFEVLNGINPRLILASVTGFGQSGFRKNYKSCDLVASAFRGPDVRLRLSIMPSS